MLLCVVGACSADDDAGLPTTSSSDASTATLGATGEGSTPASTETTTPPGPLSATSTSWALPGAWSRGVAVADGDGILLFSGLDEQKRSRGDIVRIDPATGTATVIGQLPAIEHDAAGTTLADGTVVMIGGGEQEVGTDAVVAITGLRAGEVIGHIAEARSDLSAVAVGDTAFVVGGYDGTSWISSVLASEDGVTWRSIADTDPAVRYGAVVADGGLVYVFGGRTATGQTDAVQAIDPATGTVRTVGRLPQPLGHASAFSLGGSIFVAGGRTGDTTTTATDEIWRFDAADGSLTAAGRLPYPVSDAAVAVVGDHAFLLGGEDEVATPQASVVELGLG